MTVPADQPPGAPDSPSQPCPTTQQIASATAADLAAELVRAGLAAPASGETVGVCVIEEAGLRVVVRISRYEGPAKIYLARGVDPEKYPGAIPPPDEPSYTIPPERLPTGLTALQRLIMSILDKQTYRKGDWIAAKLKKPNDGNLRTALSKLLKLRLLTKNKDGCGYRINGDRQTFV